MDLYDLRCFFMWCTIINAVLLCISFVLCATVGNWIYRYHSRWFPMSREAFNTTIYSLLGIFKSLLILFNLVPYLALLIMA